MNLNGFLPFLKKVSFEQELASRVSSLKDDIEKLSSAHFADVEYAKLPVKTQEDIQRFAHCVADTKLIHYGMVVKELLSKVDKHNFESAEKNLKDEKINEKEFYKKLSEKYLLLINDKLVDGHHYLALAKKIGVTSSLNVLDLTPVRFQEKKSYSLWDVLKSKIV